ncbi:hypothetical protein QZH41_006451 [Actinostola sp. cb2023]|nr:hypothetical protein QZH41_006451 [Actinostola sp. cb2023]
MIAHNLTNISIPDFNSTLISNVTYRGRQSGLCLNTETDGTRAAKTIAYVMVFLVSLFGNSLIVAVIFKNKRMQTPVNFFILNMAISDLLITVFFMPRMFSRIFYGIEWLVTGTTGLILCKISPSMQEFCSSLSVLLFMTIAVDRYLAVILPLKKIITKRVSFVIIGLIWLLALGIRSPTFYGFTLFKRGSKVYCASLLKDPVADQIYRQFSFVIFYAVPLCIVIVLYSAIIVALKKRKRPGATSLTQQNIQLKRTHRILKMLVTIVASFSICWFLYFCLPVLARHMHYQNVLCYLFFPMFFFCHLNCAFNPMVYLIFIENYRRGVRSILARVLPKRCCVNAVGPYDENSTSELKNITRGRSFTAGLDKTFVVKTTGDSPL